MKRQSSIGTRWLISLYLHARIFSPNYFINPGNYMKRKKENWETLDTVLESIWAMLKKGSSRFNDPFHWPVLGTIKKDGCQMRCVILRQLILPERILVCHTDSRALKVREISDSDNVSWLFYNPKKMVQLRISGKAKLHRDDQFADEQWAASGLTSRLNYCATQPPGTEVDKPSSGLPDFLKNKVPTLIESARGRKNFMAISTSIDSMDWLLLSILGNRRARFEWDNEKVNATWLIP
jgi:pyridoxamine 5'-phosphate oxidase